MPVATSPPSTSNMFWSFPLQASPELKAAVDAAYGNFTTLNSTLITAANGVFGSGWAWVCVEANGAINVTTTAGGAHHIAYTPQQNSKVP